MHKLMYFALYYKILYKKNVNTSGMLIVHTCSLLLDKKDEVHIALNLLLDSEIQ